MNDTKEEMILVKKSFLEAVANGDNYYVYGEYWLSAKHWKYAKKVINKHNKTLKQNKAGGQYGSCARCDQHRIVKDWGFTQSYIPTGSLYCYECYEFMSEFIFHISIVKEINEEQRKVIK